jgi:hypothetical protein
MKICYIISTCDKYLETRVKYQMDICLKNVNPEDIYYLTSKPNHDKRQFGWYTMDDAQNITWKYIHFIKNMNTILNYDWYLFIDDDTFVFIDRLQKLLSNYDNTENYYIGHELDHIKNEFCLYMSGGGGYAISNALYKLIYNYVDKIGINEAYYPLIKLKEQFCDDLCIGIWINKISETNKVIQLNNRLFHIYEHKNEEELIDAITFHKVITKEQYLFYYSIFEKMELNNKPSISAEKMKGFPANKTVFVLVSDLLYLNKAKRTIMDLRSKGNWKEDIVLITIDFDLNANFKDFYNVIEAKFPSIDKTEIMTKIGVHGFSNSDKRELNKLNQWEKLHVFDDYFMKWNRVVFLDAGLRVLDDVKYLLELDYKGKFLAPTDGVKNQTFDCQLSYDNPEMVDKVKKDFGESILQKTYFLNCIWIYDTNILNLCSKKDMLEAMNTYTLCRTNEMGIMNLLLHFKFNLWEPFPFKIPSGKILFDWCELNNPNTNWREYCYIKYPVTISFDDC